MKLKTLKDFEDLMVSYNFPNSKAFGHKIIATEILRQDAIKDIKELSKNGFKQIPEIKFIDGKLDTNEVSKAILTQETDIVVRWIKWKFNITEEDLK